MQEQRYDEAMAMRGRGFVEAQQILNTLLRVQPHPPQAGQRQLRLAIMHGDGPAPGMNTAVRAAVRLGLDRGTPFWQCATRCRGWRRATFTR